MCDKRLCACRQKAAGMAVDPAILKKLEEGYNLLMNSDSPSLLKKYLTREIFDKLKKRKTSYGSTLLHVIQSGIENLDSGIGIYAPDPEAYTLFAELFDPIIEDYHGGFGPSDIHPLPNWGNPGDMGNLDSTGLYVISTRVRTGRSLAGYPFNPSMSESQYEEIENKVSERLMLVRHTFAMHKFKVHNHSSSITISYRFVLCTIFFHPNVHESDRKTGTEQRLE